MTVWCVENLHRLPCEVGLPVSLVIAAMIAHGQVNTERAEELEKQVRRAKDGW